MQQVLRNRSSLVAILLLGSFGAGAWLWRSAEGRTALMIVDPPGGGGYSALTLAQRDRVLSVMRDIALDADALIALNLTSAQAESVLAACREWVLANASSLGELDASIQQGVVAVRRLEQEMAVGPYSAERDQSLAQAREDLASANTSRQSSLAALASSVRQLLSESQSATWTTIQTGHGEAMPLRMLNLSDAQRQALSDARIRFERTYSTAVDASARSEAVSAHQSALDQWLTEGQKSAIQAYASYRAEASAAVTEALAEVLATATQG